MGGGGWVKSVQKMLDVIYGRSLNLYFDFLLSYLNWMTETGNDNLKDELRDKRLLSLTRLSVFHNLFQVSEPRKKKSEHFCRYFLEVRKVHTVSFRDLYLMLRNDYF